MCAGRIVMETDFERQQSFCAEVNALGNLSLRPVPEIQVMAVFPSLHLIKLEAGARGARGGPFAAYHHVVSRLVPVIVVEVHPLGPRLPSTGDLEVVVEEQETTRSVEIFVAEHRNH